MKKINKSPTAFQQKVYAMVSLVPAGKVTTYKHLARAIGCRSPRAVGQALRCNPFAPVVPCHRVIKSDLSIGGFSGEREGKQIAKKKDMLRKEGVLFVDNKLKSEQDLFVLPVANE